MKLIANNVPYRITGDATGKIGARTWEEAKEPYADHIIDMITDTYAPNFKSLILKRVVHSPVDMERIIPSAVRGTVCHGAFRPLPDGPYASDPGTEPITGLRFQTYISAARAATRELEYRWRRDAMLLMSSWPT